MKGDRSRSPDRRRHLDHLATAHGITIEWSERRRCYAYARSRKVRINRPSTQVRYLVALHEIGHLIAPGRSGRRVQQEMAAWRWAIEAAEEPLADDTIRFIHRCVTSYVLKASRCRSWVLPAEEHPFWTWYSEIAGWAKSA